MITLFENEDFILKSTGHDYDFVGIIETKTPEPLTFFFSEEYVPHNIEDEEEWDGYAYDDNIDESKTTFLGVHQGLHEYQGDFDIDEEEDMADEYRFKNKDVEIVDFFRTRDDRSTGFMSDPKERGWFLALIKAYCPDKLKEISWA
jgi:hypothetical protein